MTSRWREHANAWTAPLGAALGYFALATATIVLTSDGRSHATVWPADAVVLALLLTRPRATWPAILWAGWLANLAANIATRGWGPWLVLYGAINMAQVLFAAHMLRRHRWEGGLLADGASLTRFILWAGLAAPAMGGTLGAIAGAINFGTPLAPSALRWFASSALGLLILTPFLADMVSGEYQRCFRSRSWAGRAERAALVALTAAVALFVFTGPPLPILFATFIPLIVSAFRVGRLGVQAGVLVIALVGALATLLDSGPFATLSGDVLVQTYAFQFYLAALTLTALPVAAVVGARHDALLRLHEREETLRLLMAHSTDVLLRFDPAGVCLSAHGPINDLLGIGARRMVGSSLSRPGARVEPAAVEAFAAALSSGAVRTAELVLPHRPGVTLEAAFKAVIDDGHATSVVATVRDVTARTQAEAALRHAADTDGLTGLLNRGGFDKRLAARLAAATVRRRWR
ncbi:hypothetical protein ASG29_01640 [Sphingomonas sp. Leaf412]|uniref:MASE1 domain-containing protein n=1 Tax=Sphingomonas sp. Leaf412 TaxID=1736370 RepID=UPI0006F3041C|nr:MASE1 domain-containing protein [Sphingomonas sp. Leaf412]KQT34883.1 hypothetical protein ASG29_01640 [Sphingomonas sp. Leaf412]